MRCSAGHENVAGAAFCVTCGLAMPSVAPPVVQSNVPSWPAAPTGTAPFGAPSAPTSMVPRNGMGTAALVLGILSFLCGWILGLLAIIFGAIGIARANRGEATNKGMAVAGLILGIVFFSGWVIYGLSHI